MHPISSTTLLTSAALPQAAGSTITLVVPIPAGSTTDIAAHRLDSADRGMWSRTTNVASIKAD